MQKKKENITSLKAEIRKLQLENKKLKSDLLKHGSKHTVKVPKNIKPVFDKAEKIVYEYFKSLKISPSKGSIEIDKERYVLVRASALSYEFLKSIKQLYQDQGEDQALNIGKNFLFDIAHVIGIEDAHNFHTKMKLKDPLSKLSAGPVHFAYTGWASVEINPESKPSPDENFFLKYNHPSSFEADSWIKSKKKTDFPVCIMNAGYSSGWCEASFGMPLTAVEISCRAKGDKECTFIMAPPHKIESYIKGDKKIKDQVSIPTFLERKQIEEKLRSSEERYRDLLEHATDLIQSVDMEGKIIFVNESWRNSLGYSEEEIEGKNIFQFIHPESHEHCKNLMADIASGKIKKVNKFDIALLAKNKRTVLVEGNISIKTQNDKVVATTSIFRNVTERKIAEERIQQSLHEKEVLLKEVHHRVKNNLQIISSLLSLQSETIDDLTAKEKYQESIGRIKSMSIIHELLYRSKNLSTIKIKDYLNELVSYISQTYNVKGEIKVDLVFDLNKESIDIHKAIPCGIIINELISNAFKYAFPSEKKGTVVIEFTGTGKRHYKLKVSDNGIGIPKNIDLINPDTLGMQLISSLVDQLDGKIKVDSENGTTFTIVFSAD